MPAINYKKRCSVALSQMSMIQSEGTNKPSDTNTNLEKTPAFL